MLKDDFVALRLASEEAIQQNKKWKDEIFEQNVRATCFSNSAYPPLVTHSSHTTPHHMYMQERLGDSLALFIEKLEQEKERGEVSVYFRRRWDYPLCMYVCMYVCVCYAEVGGSTQRHHGASPACSKSSQVALSCDMHVTCRSVQVDNLRTQLTQIEHTTTNKCQDLEDLVEDFQSKVCCGSSVSENMHA